MIFETIFTEEIIGFKHGSISCIKCTIFKWLLSLYKAVIEELDTNKHRTPYERICISDGNMHWLIRSQNTKDVSKYSTIK